MCDSMLETPDSVISLRVMMNFVQAGICFMAFILYKKFGFRLSSVDQFKICHHVWNVFLSPGLWPFCVMKILRCLPDLSNLEGLNSKLCLPFTRKKLLISLFSMFGLLDFVFPLSSLHCHSSFVHEEYMKIVRLTYLWYSFSKILTLSFSRFCESPVIQIVTLQPSKTTTLCLSIISVLLWRLRNVPKNK